MWVCNRRRRLPYTGRETCRCRSSQRNGKINPYTEPQKGGTADGVLKTEREDQREITLLERLLTLTK